MTPQEALDIAIARVGSMTALAHELGVTKGAVFQWTMEGRRIPAEHCPEIERLSGGEAKCEAMRPDVNWSYLRGPCRRRRSPKTSLTA